MDNAESKINNTSETVTRRSTLFAGIAASVVSMFSGTTTLADANFSKKSGPVNKFATFIGNSSLTSFTIKHDLNTFDVAVTIYDISRGTFYSCLADVTPINPNEVVIGFATPPIDHQYRVIIIG
jgi:hypothetical protein